MLIQERNDNGHIDLGIMLSSLKSNLFRFKDNTPNEVIDIVISFTRSIKLNDDLKNQKFDQTFLKICELSLKEFISGFSFNLFTIRHNEKLFSEFNTQDLNNLIVLIELYTIAHLILSLERNSANIEEFDGIQIARFKHFIDIDEIEDHESTIIELMSRTFKKVAYLVERIKGLENLAKQILTSNRSDFELLSNNSLEHNNKLEEIARNRDSAYFAIYHAIRIEVRQCNFIPIRETQSGKLIVKANEVKELSEREYPSISKDTFYKVIKDIIDIDSMKLKFNLIDGTYIDWRNKVKRIAKKYGNQEVIRFIQVD